MHTSKCGYSCMDSYALCEMDSCVEWTRQLGDGILDYGTQITMTEFCCACGPEERRYQL